MPTKLKIDELADSINRRHDRIALAKTSKNVRRFLRQSKSIASYLRFTVANEMALPEELGMMREWLAEYDRVRIG